MQILRRGLFLASFAWALLFFSAANAADPPLSWTLPEAVSWALANSPDAAIARHRINAAQASLQQAQAAFWPRLEFQSSYLRTDNPMQVFGSALNQRAFSPTLDFNRVPDVDNLNVKGLVTLPLYAGGQNSAARDAAKAISQSEHHLARAVQNTLAFEVARAFHTVLKTKEFITATEATTRAFETNASLAQKRFNAGSALKTEVLDVEVRLAQAREDLVRARNAHALAERSLRNLVGIDTGNFPISDNNADLPAPAAGDFSQRPELEAIRLRQQAAQSQVLRASGTRRPRLNAFGSVDYDEGWKLDGAGRGYTAGVLLQWDLWDGNLARGKINEAEALFQLTLEEERKLRLAFDLEAEQARLQLKDAQERLTATAKAVQLAEESAQLTRARFEQGLALAAQLIDAETALVNARVRRAEAKADERIAVAALRRSLGLSQIPNPKR